MIVAGGVYLEVCITPQTEQLLGSAGRAALGLSALREDLVLHTFHPEALWKDVQANFVPYGIECRMSPSAERITFEYLFPLARPTRTSISSTLRPHVRISGREILSYGCVEGDFLVDAHAAVFDPQGVCAELGAMGAATERLALVLNANEALAQASADDLPTAAAKLLSQRKAQTVVIKDGPNGAYILEARGSFQHVPAYDSKSNYTIGSGDVFSAIFAHFWLDGMKAADAADRASRHTAAYVEAPVLPFSLTTAVRAPRRGIASRRLVLLCNLSTISSQWFAQILLQAVDRLGSLEADLIDLADVLAGRIDLDDDVSLLVCPQDLMTYTLVAAHPVLGSEKATIFLDEALAAAAPKPSPRAISDLSQAVYNACWSSR